MESEDKAAIVDAASTEVVAFTFVTQDASPSSDAAKEDGTYTALPFPLTSIPGSGEWAVALGGIVEEEAEAFESDMNSS